MSNNLPTAVQKQIDAAAAAQQGLEGNTEKPDQAPAPIEVVEQPQSQRQEEKLAEPVQEAKQPAEDKENDPQYWKARHDVLQGKYNKEVPALSSDIRELKRTIEELNRKPEPEKSYLSDEEREEYGDVATMMERIAKQAAKDATDPVKETSQQASQQLYYRDLDGLAEGWAKTNGEPGFNEWLDETESMSGRTRRELLNDAFSSGNAERTAMFFNAYGSAPNKEADANRDPDQPKPLPKPAKGEELSTDPVTDRYTGAQIKQFYDDKVAGKYRGREEEAKAIEQQIFASQ